MILKRTTNLVAATVLAVSALFVLTPAVLAADDTCTWTGAGTGTQKDFLDAANWGDGAGPIVECDGTGIPESGDTLVFPALTADKTDILLSADFTIGSTVTFSGTGGAAYKIGGTNVLTINGGTIANNSDQEPNLNVDVTLASNVTIQSTSGNGVLFGSSTVTDKTVALGSFTLTLGTGIGSEFYSKLTGTGTSSVATSGTSGFRGDNSGFGGLIAATGANTSLWFYGTASLKGSVMGSTSGKIFLNSLHYGDNKTITNAITINNSGDSSNPAIQLYFIPTDDRSVAATTIEFTNVQLTKDTTISVTDARTIDVVKFSGAGLGSYTINPLDGSSGVLNYAGEDIYANSRTITLSDQSPTIDAYVSDNTILVINGSRKDITVYDGGILKGTGTVGVLTVNKGTVAPGQSPGVLNSGNVTYTSGNLDVEIGGTAAGEYDQLNVTGTVNLGSGTVLNVVHWDDFRPAQGNTFTIINNDSTDSVTGTFAGLAEGGKVTVDGVEYTISYVGGDGNDVVLTATSVPTNATAPNTGFLSQNPLATTVITLMTVAGITIIARRQIAQNKK